MIFLSSLIVSILGTIIGTIVELVQIEEADHLTAEGLNYSFLPDSIITNRVVYLILMYFTLLVTGFFILPISLLFFI
jgi:hypothetical protein